MPAGEFFAVMLPLAALSLLLLLIAVQLLPNEPVRMSGVQTAAALPKKETCAYAALFVLNLLVVFRVLSWIPALVITVLGVLLLREKRLFRQVDYALLFTFVGFFVFVGNAGRVPAVSTAIQHILNGREILVSALFSQFLSNVPAALLLSGFTDNFAGLLVGVNVGGLGTLIASMASLISYKLYAESEGAKKGSYFLTFTLYNVAGLILLLAFALLYYHF